ncbi:Rhodanese-like domain,THIF-type NAD/FAD binding fold,Adenylyltransferase and sulfurtransferase MOCS3/Uba4 [Cinara cedri]|uniref:Adenylyltransferase and sulfurtransferase MOCS3 homolog n=1 Tax=Cinara cedri TaxID=506608 RepID=A0A5E4N3R4_9HEMI|nr:Rhodanese-like domain,THIF-type NAD/FAD binding fold,Adenylyltransferase and sulfurtransferase MOCS3/Uba4 [Cinara cedri]
MTTLHKVNTDDKINDEEINCLKEEIALLKNELNKKIGLLKIKQKKCLTNLDVSRYSRQIILPEIGIEGQRKLKTASVLIIGVGGLGCPSSMYLVSAGVGTIGLVDYDEVELNNLHRQLLHAQHNVGMRKVESGKLSLNRINEDVNIVVHDVQLDGHNSLDIFKQYDVIIDASDNLVTRYIINDTCVKAGKPLVSGSAIHCDGQLTVYNYKGSVCFRCLHPKPQSPETVGNCASAGVLGPVPGVIGVLQAMETIKIIIGHPNVLYNSLLLYDGGDCDFKKIKLINVKRNGCICTKNPEDITITMDYEEFCGSKANDKFKTLCLLNENERLTVLDLKKLVSEKQSFLIIDVRNKIEYDMCHLPHTINIQLNDLKNEETLTKLIEKINSFTNTKPNLVTICRRGNDSQRAVNELKKHSQITNKVNWIKDVIGGLHDWSMKIDKDFPIY